MVIHQYSVTHFGLKCKSSVALQYSENKGETEKIQDGKYSSLKTVENKSNVNFWKDLSKPLKGWI